MHLSRIGLEGEGKVLGSIALFLGSAMVVGTICGAAGISVRHRLQGSATKMGLSFRRYPAPCWFCLVFWASRGPFCGCTSGPCR